MSERVQRKLLIVDDEKDIRDLCSTIIKRYFDFEIFSAGSLKEAEKIAGQNKIDFVILDLHLPDGVGFDLVPFLKNTNPKLKFLVVTAYNHCVEKKRAEELGAEKLLSKPFKSVDLKLEVEQMLECVND
jgi:two-component system copper resistance phosphate regulon response regulator CusR